MRLWAGLVLVLPYLAPLIITPAGGMYADKLITSGKPVGHVRKIMCSITLLGPASAFAVLVAVPQPSPFLATLLSTLAIGCLGCGDSSYWAAYVDISPRFAGKKQRCLRHSGPECLRDIPQPRCGQAFSSAWGTRSATSRGSS